MSDSGHTPANGLSGAGEVPLAVLRAILDRTAHPFLVIDKEGTFRYVGGSMERILGRPAAELVGRNMVEFLTPEGVAQAVEVVAEIDTEDRTGAGVPMVFEVLQADGSSRWAEIGAIPLFDLPDFEGIALRCRPWDGQHCFDEFVTSLLGTDPLSVVLDRLCRSIAASLEATGAAVHHGFDGAIFAAATGYGLPRACLDDGGPWVAAARSGDLIESGIDSLPPGVADAAGAAGLHAAWTAAVPHSDGLAPAALTVWRSVPGRMLRGHRQVLDRSLRYVQLALLRNAEHQRLQHLAGHDSLTGVPNRAQFRDWLAGALSIGERNLALAFCDLDGFKAVNDTYGHTRGDKVLMQVADRLRASLRAGDELARMGGDEFTVLLRNVADAEGANQIVDRLLGALGAPFVVDGDEVSLGMSIGIALAGDDSTADSLLASADEALYAVKRAGGRSALVVGSVP